MELSKKIFVIFAIFSMAVSLGAFLAFAENLPSPDPQYFPPSNEDVVESKVGEAFSITLESNGTTGYNWQFSKPLDNTMLHLVNSRYIAPTTSLLGAGGKETWTFRALKAGETHIAMKYIRPWEKDTPPAKVEYITVIIEE